MKITLTDEELEAQDGLKSPVVLRSEYESLRQEYVRHMQFLASHEDMPEGLRNYCSRTLDFLEMDLDS